MRNVRNRTWAEINLDALSDNMKNIRRITDKNALVCAVVKADAYGHGAVECARVLLENGADRLAVATVTEGIELRQNGIDAPILILGLCFEEDADAIAEYDITPAVADYEFAKALSRAAVKAGKAVKIHIKLDTGMTRIGFVVNETNVAEVAEKIAEISALDNIETEGMFSHFSTSDELDRSYTLLQFRRFVSVDDELKKMGINIPVRHICNSAGIMMYPEMHLDMVRPGIILYGMYPSCDVDKSVLPLRYVMTLMSRISFVKTVEKGRGVSYGKEYITDKQTKIATVPVGYADGYIRKLKDRAKIVVEGRALPVIGRICMDQCMINASGVNNINRGDSAVIFGDGAVTVDDVAEWLETINYEVTCMVSRRIPRIYIRNGKAVKTLDYLTR